MSPTQKRILESISETGASSWLLALPIKDQGFYLDKQSFSDAINLRYGIDLLKLPMHCVCGSAFTIEHALSCKTGGFISIRHNELSDTTADSLSEICKDVTLEPKLTNLTGEKFAKRSANTQDDARVDVSARGFWARGSKAFMDIRVFNPLAQTYSSQSLSAAYRKNELQKKREYNTRILEVEHGSFTPLVFSCFGGMSFECKRFYQQLGGRLVDKRCLESSVVQNWLRTKLSFSLLRTLLLCIRGSRSIKFNVDHVTVTDILLQSAKANI